jgi:hypothetical protein
MTHWGRLGLALLLTGCCFDGLTPPTTAAPLPPPSSPGTGTGPLLPGGSASGIGTPLAFGAGSGDPTFAQGFAGGPLAGTSFDPSCYAGHYSVAPSHVLTLSSPLPYARIMAYSARGTDLTLLVRQPNGVVLCNDDSDGLNPTVELSALTTGQYQIYVGNYSSVSPEPYELGVSTSSTVTSTTMHYAAPTVVQATGAAPAPQGETLLQTGTASVTSITGSIAGVAVGTACTYTQTRVAATGGPGVLDCRWQVTCGVTDLYGGTVPGGYQPCSDPTWSAATVAMDSNTSATDTDPTFLFSGSTITVGDDASGVHGAFTVTLTTSAPGTPPAPPMPMVPQAGS